MKAEIKVRYMILRHRSKTAVENHFEEREERTLRKVQLRRWALHCGSCLGASTRLKAPSKSTVVFLGSGNGHRGEGADKQNKHPKRWASFSCTSNPHAFPAFRLCTVQHNHNSKPSLHI